MAESTIFQSHNSRDDVATKEMTVGELIDRHIDKAERQARDLRILKDAMSQGFLQSGASKISSLLEI